MSKLLFRILLQKMEAHLNIERIWICLFACLCSFFLKNLLRLRDVESYSDVLAFHTVDKSKIYSSIDFRYRSVQMPFVCVMRSNIFVLLSYLEFYGGSKGIFFFVIHMIDDCKRRFIVDTNILLFYFTVLSFWWWCTKLSKIVCNLFQTLRCVVFACIVFSSYLNWWPRWNNS